MADLVFHYGAMGCGKTANALMTHIKYKDRGLKVWLIKPEIDTRDDVINPDGSVVSLVKSRIGISGIASVIKTDQEIMPPADVRLIICDEAQFLSENQVDNLKAIAETLDIPVYCYGLRTDFRAKLFPGAKRLFEIASRTVELESICSCGNPAIINARFNSKGEIVTRGSVVELGGDDRYKALCYSCWKSLSESSVN